MCFVTLALIDRAMGRPPMKPSRYYYKQLERSIKANKKRYSKESDHSEKNKHNVECIEIDEEDEHEW